MISACSPRFKREDDAHAVAVAFVARLVHALEFLLVDEAGHVLDEPGLVHLVGNLGDHNLLVVFAGALDGGLGAELDLPAARGVGRENPLPPEDEAAGGKSGPCTNSRISPAARRDAESGGWRRR